MNFLKWIWGLLFRQSLKVNRDITTKKFQDFEKYYRMEDLKENIWMSRENFLLRYISEIKLSPFLGDDNLEEARKFLKEQGVTEKII